MPKYTFMGFHSRCGGNIYLTPSNHGKYFYPTCMRCRMKVVGDDMTNISYPKVRQKTKGVKRAPRPKFDYSSWKDVK